jgi:pimeloyl-ACP methyl ester carboxylesterase
LSDHLANQSKHYAQINTPLLSLAASDDRVVPPANHHYKLIKANPNVQALEIDGAGHAPHHTRTDEVISAIGSYIKTI